jgi:DNA-binding response OmpR family regulator
MSNTPHILVIEDDHDIRELITLQLELKNYQVSAAANGMEALNLINNNDYDLFLIDRMLPDSNGIAICEKLRASEKNQITPIILLTALSEPEDIIKGLDSGADDYITKPFDINILHARVRAQLRRLKPQEESKDQLQFEGLSIDLPKCKVKVEDKEINLTHTEYQILITLAQSPGIVHSRRSLIEKILGDDIHVTNRTIDTHIAGLRKKLNDKSTLIETIRGIGYRMQDTE